jgi:hypothetical protein
MGVEAIPPPLSISYDLVWWLPLWEHCSVSDAITLTAARPMEVCDQLLVD